MAIKRVVIDTNIIIRDIISTKYTSPRKIIVACSIGEKKFDYWGFEESNHFLTWAMNNSFMFPVYQMAYELGLRMGEIVSLQKDAVNLSQKLVHIRQNYCKASGKVIALTKSGHERILGLNDGLVTTLQKAMNNNCGPFVFSNHMGEMMSHDFVRYHFHKDQRLSEVRKIKFHDLRHTFASHFVMRGGNIYDLKALLGHADISTTMRYAHLAPNHLQKQASLVCFKIPAMDNVVELKQENSSTPIPLMKIN